jgi:L,D-peptidoglycan transpeptidase YkuD (ErfK/YbiS/YcfS/YnhG family)
MGIEVRAAGPTTGIAEWRGVTYRCSLGRAGIRLDKREGDGTTPVGAFALRRVLYRPDRLAAPRTALPARAITSNDGWCDDPGDPSYNRPVQLPYPASAETLWREDALYDVIVVLGHNDDPPIAGLGSAIFLHVARDDFGPTQGCIALARADLLAILATVAPSTRLIVHPP